MEKQQRKFEGERKILQEQMAADAKAQQEQIENMIKASMQKAEEDRRAFMQENQALNARLGEMQRSNQEMQQMIASLNQQITQNNSRQREVRKPGFFDSALQVVSGPGSLIGAGVGVVENIRKCNVM